MYFWIPYIVRRDYFVRVSCLSCRSRANHPNVNLPIGIKTKCTLDNSDLGELERGNSKDKFTELRY